MEDCSRASPRGSGASACPRRRGGQPRDPAPAGGRARVVKSRGAVAVAIQEGRAARVRVHVRLLRFQGRWTCRASPLRRRRRPHPALESVRPRPRDQRPPAVPLAPLGIRHKVLLLRVDERRLPGRTEPGVPAGITDDATLGVFQAGRRSDPRRAVPAPPNGRTPSTSRSCTKDSRRADRCYATTTAASSVA